MEKVEEGLVVIKDGKGWNAKDGWVDLVDATLYDSEYISRPSDVTYITDPFAKELDNGKLVKVKRVTNIKLKE